MIIFSKYHKNDLKRQNAFSSILTSDRAENWQAGNFWPPYSISLIKKEIEKENLSFRFFDFSKMTKLVKIRIEELGDENPFLEVIFIENFEYEFGNLITFLSQNCSEMPWWHFIDPDFGSAWNAQAKRFWPFIQNH